MHRYRIGIAKATPFRLMMPLLADRDRQQIRDSFQG
jgi:hypothetical protein